MTLCVNEARRSTPEQEEESKPGTLYARKFCPKKILPKTPNYEALRPYFAWATVDRIKDTLKNTTQWFRAENRVPLRRHYKTQFSAANVKRINKDVATDTFLSEVPAINDGIPGHGGCTMLQLFVGLTSKLTECIPMKGDVKSNFPDTFKEFIRRWGAPRGLFSDNALEQNSQKVYDILRYFNIEHWNSEPDFQNQNPAERRIQDDVKWATEGVMDRTRTPPGFWLLCTLYGLY